MPFCSVFNWMLPVVYGFIAGTMPVTESVYAVRDITLMCKNTGVKLIATCCDQGSTNVAAINHFRFETERVFGRMTDERFKEMKYERGFNLEIFQ